MKKKQKGCLPIIIILLVIGLFSMCGGSDEESKENDVVQQESSKDYSFDVDRKGSKLYDKKDFKIELTEEDFAGSSLSFKFTASNNTSGDGNISIVGCAVNNVMVEIETDEIFDVFEVPKDKKQTVKVEIDKTNISNVGIDEIKNVKIYFHIYTSDDYNTIADTVVELKSKKDDKKYTVVKSDKLYSDANVSVGYIKTEDNGYYFTIKNKSKSDIYYSVEKCSINEWAYDLSESDDNVFQEPLLKNCYGIFKVNVTDDFMSENGIDKISNITFKIEAENEYDIISSKPPIKTKEIKLKLK